MKALNIFMMGTLLITMFLAITAKAEITTSAVEYTSDGVTMEGYVAYDDSVTDEGEILKPGILIVHDWMGLGSFGKEKAELLAKEGYVAFAVDVYGKGIRPPNNQEAGKLAEIYKNDRALFRKRLQAAYDTLVAMNHVDAKKVLVMGYCFGGTAALELARSGAPLIATVSFHGGLSNPAPSDAQNIKGAVLVLHGADDPFVPAEEVAAFKAEMTAAKIPMEFIAYPGAVHAFTNPNAGNDNSKGAAYNAAADKESWAAFEKFLKQHAPIHNK